MKKKNNLILCLLAIFVLMLGLCGCSCSPAVDIDYADAESFEIMLNEGEDMKDKVVQFTVADYKPDSLYGCNIWAGEHLNFVSSDDPNVKVGDTVIVKVKDCRKNLGSWIINYERVKEGKTTDKTINKDSQSIVGKTRTIELKESGWYVKSAGNNDITIGFCGVIANPNESLTAQFPKMKVTIKNNAGKILASSDTYAGDILPGDSGVAVGQTDIPAGENTDELQVQYDLECDKYVKTSSINVRSSDFKIYNVSEIQRDSYLKITGEVKNNSKDNCSANIIFILKREGKIVECGEAYVTGLNAGTSQAFEGSIYRIPEYDTVECHGQASAY